MFYFFSGGVLRSRRGGDEIDMSSTETESLLSSRQDYYDDTESSITSVSQIANCKISKIFQQVLH